ncbi:MAG TPA: ABC transporter substrate-binding protein [Dehalococcoidia bacterium]|nr:ABC transporter substrate-binding protein [Dehalococcoidia bacterium]
MASANYWSKLPAVQTSRRRLLSAAGALGGGLALAACSSSNNGKKASTPAGAAGGASAPAGSNASAGAKASSAAQPKQGGTLNFYTTDPAYYKQSDMDVALNTSIWHLIGKRALTLEGETKKLQGETVESWEIPGDGTQFILHVRQNVKTHNKPPTNGRLFNAEDLAFNINRIAGKLDPDHLALYQRASTMAGLDHAEAADQFTCKVVMTQPSSTLLAGLTEIRNELMPKDVVEAKLFDNIVSLAGHGPFMTKDYQEGQLMTAVRHPDYFVQGEPHADQLQVYFFPDSATVLSAFLSGKLDYFSPTKEQIQAVKSSKPDAKYFTWPDLNWDHIRFQVEKPPFTDFRVRRALFLAIDYKQLADGTYGNEWTYTGPLVPQHPEAYTIDQIKQLPGYNPSTKDKDIQSAKQLMAAAGFQEGEIAFQIMPGSTLPTNTWYENSIRVQDQLKKIWPKINVQVTPASDSATYAKKQASGDFSTVSYTITSLPDPVLEISSQWHTASGLYGSRNYGHFKNADVDALIEKAFQTLDNEARKNLLQDFQKRYFEEWLPAIQICEEPDRYFTSPHFGGLDQVTGPWWYTGYRINDRAGVYYKT